ncbi:hypothetical protein XA68_18540 [Ophiocordyceps unilateralis]|uniref:Uncharacterized protein n=1 Tax=Ophiocordyceps unilateralis TaxID=268505 RepID=A0A2A9P364_OPHUN|nr:hypothetical protein XA68_18540 [Ophiocordyceps unilateralis]
MRLGATHLRPRNYLDSRTAATSNSPHDAASNSGVRGLFSCHDGAADDEVVENAELGINHISRRCRSPLNWWVVEYWCAALCIAGITTLSLVLWRCDGKLSPDFGVGIKLDMIVIAIMTLVRVTLGSIVESCICQGAWIWVSKSHQTRTKNKARLEDFKLFDEASRGFLGSAALLWRLKGMHISCIGAVIILVTHGLETFSQQMFVYVQAPTVSVSQMSRPAPAPFRSDYWDNVSERGIQSGYSLTLSTKSAVYSGILAAQVRDLEPQCDTANCTWPVIPTLAICGHCDDAPVQVHCSSQSNFCTFGISSDTNVTLPNRAEMDTFRVSPVNASLDDALEQGRTYVSVFEILTITKRQAATKMSGARCALWLCLKAYNISVANGRSQQVLVATWNASRFEAATSAHTDEHVFTDIPKTLNTRPLSRYSVSDRSLKALRNFLESLTSGTFEHASNVINFSSDWIEAMWQATADLEVWIETLSQSLTNEFREHGTIRDPYETDYEGSASRMANYVHVKWLWMVYPVLILVTSLYYLLLTIVAGARDGVLAWKCDSLPMLFSRIHPSILALGSDKMNEPRGLDDLGKSRVALTKDENGFWTFEPSDWKNE